MTELNDRPRGRYFEEMGVGDTLVTAGRTVTEADIVSFAGLSGDYNQIHVDAAYAAGHMFGQRVAHGLLVTSIVTGLIVQTGIMEGTVLSFRELEWKFNRPVMIGDTVKAQLEVVEKKALPRLGGGNVVTRIRVYNQKEELVQRGTMSLLLASKPG